jgi:hypothetical protein
MSVIASTDRVVLIRIPQTGGAARTAEQLYDATRKWWTVAASRRDGGQLSPTHALAVMDKVVVAAYRIDAWQGREKDGRWSFVGEEDRAAERYVGADVSEFFLKGAQNPLRYVNCAPSTPVSSHVDRPSHETALGPLASVALQVSRCPEVLAARSNASHPCRNIVGLQPADPQVFQLPEGWAGNIQDGRIVFLSSNPSISEAGDHQSGSSAEVFPTWSWSDEDIVDFTTHRFDSRHGWATPQGKFLRRDGTLSPKVVAFWNNVRHRAAELVGVDASPTRDYAMTEIVHCKSKGEKGVAKAALTCANRHLDPIMALSPAPLVVVLGRRARDLAHSLWSLPPGFGHQKREDWVESDNVALVEIGGRPRVVAYLWHPTGSTAPKTFAMAYQQLQRPMQQLVRGEVGPGEFMQLSSLEPESPS